MMTTTALAGGVRVAVLLLLPLAAGFLAPVPASTRTHQQHLFLPALSSSYAERRPCRCRHATASAAEEALTTFKRRERPPASRRQRVSVPRRTTPRTTTTSAADTAVSCRASREDVSSPATESRPHDAGVGAGAGPGAGSASPSAVFSAATATSSTADNEKEKKGAEQEQEEHEQRGEGEGGSWSSTRLIPAAATAVPVVGVGGLGETGVRATEVAAAVAATGEGFAAVKGGYDVVGLMPEGDVAPWTEFEDWLLQDTYSR